MPTRYMLWKFVAPVLPLTIEEVIFRLHQRWINYVYTQSTLQLRGIDALDTLGSPHGRKAYTSLRKVLVEHELPDMLELECEYAVMTRTIEALPQLKAAGLLRFVHFGSW